MTAEYQLDSRAEQRATLLIYLASFSYQITLGTTTVLIPLYALHLGYDIAEIGIIVASQAVFGLMLRLSAGAISDRFGERWVLWASFLTMVVGALVVAWSGAFLALILGQTFIGFSRATYWTSTQSYASRISVARSGHVLGRINGTGNAGTLIGTFASGIMAETIGYSAGFVVTAVVGAAGFAGSLALPVLPRAAAKRGFREPFRRIPGIARHRGMGLAAFAAFVASSSMGLSAVLFVPYFSEVGHDETTIGGMRTILAVGSVAIGIVFGSVLARVGRRNMYTVALVAQSGVLLLISVGADAVWSLAAIMVLYGWFHSTLGVLYPLSAADHSAREQRGMAMAHVGLYWGTAQVVVPAGFGFLAAAVGLQASIWFASGMFLTFGLLMPVLYRWFVPGADQTFGEPIAARSTA